MTVEPFVMIASDKSERTKTNEALEEIQRSDLAAVMKVGVQD